MSMERHVVQQIGLTRYNRMRFFTAEPHPVLETQLPRQDWLLVAVVQEVIEDQKYIHHPPDCLNPDAMRRFRELTHLRHQRHLGPDLAHVASIFTDEVEPGWSPTLRPRYLERFGEPLDPSLVAFVEDSHPRHLEIRDRLQQLRLEAFIDTFERPISAWCAEAGMRYSGEKPSARLDQLAWMDIPGCEPGQH